MNNKKIFNPDGSYKIITSEEDVIQAIDYFSREMQWNQDSNKIEPVKDRFENFSKLWDSLMDNLGSGDFYWKIVNKILIKFGEKFNLEW